jgi:hypothetical protein
VWGIDRDKCVGIQPAPLSPVGSAVCGGAAIELIKTGLGDSVGCLAIDDAMRFNPPLDTFAVGVTSAPIDARLQEIAREIAREHLSRGLFSLGTRLTGFLTFLHPRPSQRPAQRLELTLIDGGKAAGRRLSASTVNRNTPPPSHPNHLSS